VCSVSSRKVLGLGIPENPDQRESDMTWPATTREFRLQSATSPTRAAPERRFLCCRSILVLTRDRAKAPMSSTAKLIDSSESHARFPGVSEMITGVAQARA
jgi:hypothetical protein